MDSNRKVQILYIHPSYVIANSVYFIVILQWCHTYRTTDGVKHCTLKTKSSYSKYQLNKIADTRTVNQS